MVLQKFLTIGLTALFFSCNSMEEKTTSKASHDTSATQLKQAIQRYPDSLQLIAQLVQHYRDEGRYDTAIIITDNAIKRDSNVAELWDIKATLHYENEDTLNSIKAFEKAIAIYPIPEYIISLGTLYAQTKDPKAIALADALILADKSKAVKEAIFIKGLYYTYVGDKKKAISYFDSCIRMDYTYMFAYREKAIALYDSGKYEEALKVLTIAVTVQNNFDEGYYWMGLCYEKLNKLQDAIQSYQTALMYDKDYLEARNALKRLNVR